MSSIDHTHDPALSSWVAGADAHADFPIQNLPLGIFSPANGNARIGCAIGDHIVDLRALSALLPDSLQDSLQQHTLNAVFACAPADRLALRQAISALLSDSAHKSSVQPHLYAAADCALHLPARIGDYTDFYVGIHHATNIGLQFRPDQPLLPNYKHVPIGYHGRASSVRLSGHDVVRPSGQRKPPNQDVPEYGPSRRLDYELELGVWIAGENALGETLPISKAPDRIAGFCLLNDWSARDIQAWEYQPLGPFLAKNFLTSISPWVVTAEAMAPFRQAQAPRPDGDPKPLPYLWDDADQHAGALALELEAHISSAQMRRDGHAPLRLSHGPASNMYWTVAQIITHHAANGCNLMPGDLLGTGTISGPDAGSFGSLMETTRSGAELVTLPTGETRAFLEDGDALSLSAKAVRAGYRSIGFGSCSGVVSPARSN
jgi:fumarylacetoacetase